MELFEEKGYTKGLAKSKAAEAAINALGFSIEDVGIDRKLVIKCSDPRKKSIVEYNENHDKKIKKGTAVIKCYYSDKRTKSVGAGGDRHTLMSFGNPIVIGGFDGMFIKPLINYLKMYCAGIHATGTSYRDEQFDGKDAISKNRMKSDKAVKDRDINYYKGIFKKGL